MGIYRMVLSDGVEINFLLKKKFCLLFFVVGFVFCFVLAFFLPSVAQQRKGTERVNYREEKPRQEV